jgi:serine/threonine-protein kinase
MTVQVVSHPAGISLGLEYACAAVLNPSHTDVLISRVARQVSLEETMLGLKRQLESVVAGFNSETAEWIVDRAVLAAPASLPGRLAERPFRMAVQAAGWQVIAFRDIDNGTSPEDGATEAAVTGLQTTGLAVYHPNGNQRLVVRGMAYLDAADIECLVEHGFTAGAADGSVEAVVTGFTGEMSGVIRHAATSSKPAKNGRICERVDNAGRFRFAGVQISRGAEFSILVIDSSDAVVLEAALTLVPAAQPKTGMLPIAPPGAERQIILSLAINAYARFDELPDAAVSTLFRTPATQFDNERVGNIVLRAEADARGVEKFQEHRPGETLHITATLGIPRRLGSYEIERELGRGGFSVVYLAKDMTSAIGRKVALKFPLIQEPGKDWDRAIKSEVESWYRLSEPPHPNVLQFEDLKRVDTFTFFVTEFMDGGNIWDALADLSPTDRSWEVIGILEQLCSGLACAHERGIVHGDVKPQNMLASSTRDRIKLADFGLATETTDDSRGGSVPFLAPESFDGKKDYCTDVYALGVSVYSLLTRHLPYPDTDSGREQLKADRLAAIPDPRERNTQIPIWLSQMVKRCLAPNPVDRFRDAREVLEFIKLRMNPRAGASIVLSALWNPESNTIDYDLELPGQRNEEMLTVPVTHGLIDGLGMQWQILGEKALDRLRSSGVRVDALNSAITELLARVGGDGSDLVLGRAVRTMLVCDQVATLWIRHDPRLGGIPWELLQAGNKPLCLTYPMARWPKLYRPRSKPWKLEREEKIRVLLIADPSGDLKVAREECDRLRDLIQESLIGENITVDVADKSVDCFTLRYMMRRCHILHYAGHAVFSEGTADPGGSGWLLKGDPEHPRSGDLFAANAVADFWQKGAAPMLVFANACRSGRFCDDATHQVSRSDAVMGLAQAFLSAGVGSYIGTVWDSPDTEATVQFAAEFYAEFLEGCSVAQALLTARSRSIDANGEPDLTWARYVLFGDPFTHIPVVQLRRKQPSH